MLNKIADILNEISCSYLYKISIYQMFYILYKISDILNQISDL